MSQRDYRCEEIAELLCAFLRDNVLADGVDITPDTELSRIGVDSFSLMELVLFIERQLNLSLPAESLNPETIASVRSLSEYCEAFLTHS